MTINFQTPKMTLRVQSVGLSHYKEVMGGTVKRAVETAGERQLHSHVPVQLRVKCCIFLQKSVLYSVSSEEKKDLDYGLCPLCRNKRFGAVQNSRDEKLKIKTNALKVTVVPHRF